MMKHNTLENNKPKKKTNTFQKSKECLLSFLYSLSLKSAYFFKVRLLWMFLAAHFLILKHFYVYFVYPCE